MAMDSTDHAGAAAVDRALRDDLSNDFESNYFETASGDGEEARARSFRKRRLTYSRHRVVTDDAAAAVAELLADGEGSSDSDDVDDSVDGGGETDDDANGAGGDGDTDSRKRKRSESASSQNSNASKRARDGIQGSPTKLPSRVLHAGEIVRRLSPNKNALGSFGDDAGDAERTGAHSRPTHPNGGHHRSKWRQRFSFCSSAPDALLPFPRGAVGTYSCHGMEPACDSDYSDSSDENEGSDGGSGGSNGRTVAKINQDRGGIAYPYGNSARQALFAVYDGHGEGGELVSQFALGEVQRLLEGKLRKLPPLRRTIGTSLGIMAEEGSDYEEEGDEKGEEGDARRSKEEEELIAEAMKEVFVTVDRGLLDEPDIEPMYSGTTACTVLLRDNKLYISNCGDSRGVLARRRRGEPNKPNKSGNKAPTAPHDLTTVPLSVDQNPDSPGEKERILSAGGYVSPPPEPGLSSRVWLDAAKTQIGLAMARSIGDHAVKGAGVIAEPVVTTHEVGEEDEFVIVATDGVWEFLSSEDAVKIVAEHLYKGGDGDAGGGASAACEALIRAASEEWHEHEGDYRDDITAIVIRLRDLWS